MAYTDERACVPSTAEGEQWHEAPGDGADGGTSPDQGGPGPAGKPRHALEGGRVYWEIARRLAKPEQFVTFVVVAAAVVFTFVQFEPSNLFRNTTISGGDTGAHVILPWIAEHQLLPNLRLTGWTSSNWDGFPAVTFYFPLPIYSIVALAKVVPYNVAFKLGQAPHLEPVERLPGAHHGLLRGVVRVVGGAQHPVAVAGQLRAVHLQVIGHSAGGGDRSHAPPVLSPNLPTRSGSWPTVWQQPPTIRPGPSPAPAPPRRTRLARAGPAHRG